MGSSVIGSAMNDIKGQLKTIPYVWDSLSIAGKTIGDKLFQNVAIWNANVPDMLAEKNNQALPVNFPCAFVELLEETNIQPLFGSDLINLRVCVHILDWQVNNEFGDYPDENMNIYDYRDLVETYLRGFKLSKGGGLTKESDSPDYSHSGLYHWKCYFKAALVDLKGNVIDENQVIVQYVIPPAPSNQFPLHENTTITLK